MIQSDEDLERFFKQLLDSFSSIDNDILVDFIELDAETVSQIQQARISTFEEDGLLTQDKGLIVTCPNGLQLVIRTHVQTLMRITK